MPLPEHDDLDLLFSVSTIMPPAQLAARTHRRVVVSLRAWRIIAALGGVLAALMLVVALSFVLGRQAAAAGAMDVITFAIGDWQAVTVAPSWYLSLVFASVVWPAVVGVALSLLALTLLATYVLRATEPPGRGGRL
jgi:uncharacterized protein YebE (UPF0316 family)